jgi:nucleoid-associated protein YgaU
MGLFDFFKGAGDQPDEHAAGPEPAQETIDELREQNIMRSMAQLDVDADQVSVDVKGEIAVLEGSAPSQEAMEKMVLCAGNQHGIAQVDCRIEVDQPEPEPEPEPLPTGDVVIPPLAQATAPPVTPEKPSTFYTVQSGDTLGKIAAAHYGNASKYTVIFEANQPMLTDPDKIYPGQSLRIPPL